MNLNLEEMQKYLKSLCEDYDKEYGRYPESSYEGRALYEHFCEKNNDLIYSTMDPELIN